MRAAAGGGEADTIESAPPPAKLQRWAKLENLMLAQPAAMLRHETPAGGHYDLLLGDPTLPDTPDAPLWAARIAWPTWLWRDARRFTITPLPPHRRRYLTYQGPVSARRGWVRRVDAGQALPRLWSADRIVLDLSFRGFRGGVALRRLTASSWDFSVL